MLANKNIVLSGVGGQGIILAAGLLSEVLFRSGFDVKKSETHGMAQRGGAVVSFVRFGRKIFSPSVAIGQADFILAFEILEAARNIPLASKNSVILMADLKIPPLPVSTGFEQYPENLATNIKKTFPDTFLIPAVELAKKAGSIKTANLVMLGALNRYLLIPEPVWEKVIREYFRDEEKLKMNLAAFRLGQKTAT